MIRTFRDSARCWCAQIAPLAFALCALSVPAVIGCACADSNRSAPDAAVVVVAPPDVGAEPECACDGGVGFHCNPTNHLCEPDKTCADYGARGREGDPCSTGPNPNWPVGDGTRLLTCSDCANGGVCKTSGSQIAGTCCVNHRFCSSDACNTSVTDECTGAISQCTCGAGKHCEGTTCVGDQYFTCAKYTSGADGTPCSNGPSPAFPRGDGSANLSCPCAGAGAKCMNTFWTAEVSGAAEGRCRTNTFPIVGFLAAWQNPTMTIDYSSITHLVLSGMVADPSSCSLSGISGGWSTAWARGRISEAKARGMTTAVLIGGWGSNSQFFQSCVDSHLSTFVTNIVATVRDSFGADGVDVDWEPLTSPGDLARSAALANAIRAAWPAVYLKTDVGWDDTGAQGNWATWQAAYDHIHIMTYQFGAYAHRSWHFAAAYNPPTDPNGTWSNSCDAVAAGFLAKGVAAAKLGIGIGGYGGYIPLGYQSNGAPHLVTAPNQDWGYPWTSGPNYPWSYFNTDFGTVDYPIVKTSYATADNYHWDSGAKNSYLSSTTGIGAVNATFLTYEDEYSAAWKAKLIRDRRLGGGIIIWTLGNAVENKTTGKSAIFDALKAQLLVSNPPTPQDGAPTSRAPNPTPLLASAQLDAGSTPASKAVNISGLSAAQRSSVVLHWVNPSTGDWDTSVVRAGSYSEPGSYTVDASAASGAGAAPPDGDPSWVNLVTVTGNTLRSRQHVLSLSPYNWVRMRVSAPSASALTGASVTAAIDLHQANGDQDSLMIIGDSITANSWQNPAWNRYVQDYCRGVQAILPNRCPILDAAGIGGQTTSSMLPYVSGWLATWPGRYVAIALGTNDAGYGVSAATYYANMKAIIDKIIAAGKVPVLPTLIWNPGPAAALPAYQTQIARLKTEYPQAIAGPDLYARFLNHNELFLDTLHPNNPAGTDAYQAAWIQWAVNSLYR